MVSETSHRPWCKACALDLAQRWLTLGVNAQAVTFCHYWAIDLYDLREHHSGKYCVAIMGEVGKGSPSQYFE